MNGPSTSQLCPMTGRGGASNVGVLLDATGTRWEDVWCFFVRGWLSQFLWVGTWWHLYSSHQKDKQVQFGKLLFFLFGYNLLWPDGTTNKGEHFLPYKLVVCCFVRVSCFSHVLSQPKLRRAGRQIIPISRWSQRSQRSLGGHLGHREVQGFRRLVDVAEKWDGQAMDQTMGRNHAPHNTIMTWGWWTSISYHKSAIHRRSPGSGCVHWGVYQGTRVPMTHRPIAGRCFANSWPETSRMISSFNWYMIMYDIWVC